MLTPLCPHRRCRTLVAQPAIALRMLSVGAIGLVCIYDRARCVFETTAESALDRILTYYGQTKSHHYGRFLYSVFADISQLLDGLSFSGFLDVTSFFLFNFGTRAARSFDPPDPSSQTFA